MLLTNQYAPSSLAGLIGNEDAKAKIQAWILNWLNGHKRRPLLIHGPTGVGKTSVAYTLAREHKLDIVALDASQVRTKDRIGHMTSGARLGSTLFGNQRIMLIDDVDSFFGNADRGGMGEIQKILEENPCPIILTATDIWDKKLAPLRNECEPLELKKINKSALFLYLKKIRDKEYPALDDEFLSMIVVNAQGDVRAALNDLQSHSTLVRDTDNSIFEKVRGIFKAQSAREAKNAAGTDIDYDLLGLWIDENLPLEYTNMADLTGGFDALSRSDIFMGRIRMSNWTYLKYAIDLRTIGVSMAKKVPYRTFTKYQFPTYLKQMSQTLERRAKRKSIGRKIGSLTHVNGRAALELLPLIQEIGKEHMQGMMDLYRFDEEELAFILGTSVNKLPVAKKKPLPKEETPKESKPKTEMPAEKETIAKTPTGKTHKGQTTLF